MLTSGNFSALHRIKQDEMWHFYDGAPLRLHVITADGEHTVHMIGKDIVNGEVPQFVVNGGCWFGAEVLEENAFSLVGCTISPGFSFEDFEMKTRKELIALFPHLEELITRMTHE